MRSATSRWNISTAASNQGGHGSVHIQLTSSAVAILYGRLATMRAGPSGRARPRIEFECVAGDDIEPTGIARGDLFQCRDGALVALDCDNPRGAERQQCARQSARPRADFQTR